VEQPRSLLLGSSSTASSTTTPRPSPIRRLRKSRRIARLANSPWSAKVSGVVLAFAPITPMQGLARIHPGRRATRRQPTLTLGLRFGTRRPSATRCSHNSSSTVHWCPATHGVAAAIRKADLTAGNTRGWWPSGCGRGRHHPARPGHGANTRRTQDSRVCTAVCDTAQHPEQGRAPALSQAQPSTQHPERLDRQPSTTSRAQHPEPRPAEPDQHRARAPSRRGQPGAPALDNDPGHPALLPQRPAAHQPSQHRARGRAPHRAPQRTEPLDRQPSTASQTSAYNSLRPRI
jgi:hypothetical protein